MKTSVKNIYLVAMLFASQLSIADSDLVPITVKVAANIHEQINKLPAAEKKRVEQAIRTGNKFIPQHFEGSAYESDLENTDWFEHTAPLIAVSRDDWDSYRESAHGEETFFVPKEVATEHGVGFTSRQVCPEINLFDLRLEKEKITLGYRSAIMGRFIHSTSPFRDFFDTQGAGGVYEVRIELNEKSLVTKVIPQDFLYTLAYTVRVTQMKNFLLDAKKDSANSSHHDIDVYVGDNQKALALMESQAKLICK